MGSLSFVMYFGQTYYNTKIILYVIFFEKVVKWCMNVLNLIKTWQCPKKYAFSDTVRM